MPSMIIAIFLLFQAVPDSSEYTELRQRMVRDQIAARGVSDEGVLQALRTVPRHRFVPERQRRLAYNDHPLPIGFGQTISQPYIVGYMTDLIEPERDQRVLEIGTGSGYQAAILAELVDSVFSIEIVPELAERAGGVLDALGYENVTVRHADGFYGWEAHAPFDAIVVTAAAEHIPPPLVEQLKPGGKMVIPVGSPFRTQMLMLVEKNRRGTVNTKSLFPVRFVPFRRAP